MLKLGLLSLALTLVSLYGQGVGDPLESILPCPDSTVEARLLGSSGGPEKPGFRFLNGIQHPEDELQVENYRLKKTSLAEARCECAVLCEEDPQCTSFILLQGSEVTTCKTLSVTGDLIPSEEFSESWLMHRDASDSGQDKSPSQGASSSN